MTLIRHRVPLKLKNYLMEWIKFENYIEQFVGVELLLNISIFCSNNDSGFCEECVKKMKDDYEKALNEYMPISQQYEKVYSNNVNREVKMATIKAKIASMKQKLQEGDVAYMDADLKVMRDELDYLRK